MNWPPLPMCLTEPDDFVGWAEKKGVTPTLQRSRAMLQSITMISLGVFMWYVAQKRTWWQILQVLDRAMATFLAKLFVLDGAQEVEYTSVSGISSADCWMSQYKFVCIHAATQSARHCCTTQILFQHFLHFYNWLAIRKHKHHCFERKKVLTMSEQQ